MSEETGAPETMANGEDNLPQVALIAQYVKDLSFENPSAPGIYQAPEQPKIDVQFNIGSQLAGEDVYEVALKIEVTATQGDLTAYAVELMAAAATTADAQEGIAAFLAKRHPNFTERA